MGDIGIKISEEGSNVNTSGLNNTGFDSRYSSLMFIEKQTIEFTAPSGQTGPSGTETYTHNYGYFPLVLAFVETYGNGMYGSVPYFYVNSPFPGSYVETAIDMKIKETTIDIDWRVNEYLPGVSYPLSGDLPYKVSLYIYGFGLGYQTN